MNLKAYSEKKTDSETHGLLDTVLAGSLRWNFVFNSRNGKIIWLDATLGQQGNLALGKKV